MNQIRTNGTTAAPVRISKNYATRKEAARQEAIDWQMWASDQNLSYGEMADYMAHFESLARRYGLMKEFRENAII